MVAEAGEFALKVFGVSFKVADDDQPLAFGLGRGAQDGVHVADNFGRRSAGSRDERRAADRDRGTPFEHPQLEEIGKEAADSGQQLAQRQGRKNGNVGGDGVKAGQGDGSFVIGEKKDMTIAEVIHAGLFDNRPEFMREGIGVAGQKRVPRRFWDLVNAVEYSCFQNFVSCRRATRALF